MSMTSSRQDSVFERLYSAKEKRDIVTVAIDLDSLTRQELEECTFQPSIPSFLPERLQNSRKPTGFDEYVTRIKESYSTKAKTQEEKENALFSFDNARYMRSRRIAAMGPSPFVFNESKARNDASKAPR